MKAMWAADDDGLWDSSDFEAHTLIRMLWLANISRYWTVGKKAHYHFNSLNLSPNWQCLIRFSGMFYRRKSDLKMYQLTDVL